MKPILVLTDFSAPAENAMLFAAAIAEKINTGIVLFHVFQLPVTMSDVPVMIVSADELKQNADHALNNAKEMLQKSAPSITITCESRMGDVSDELKDFCKEQEPFAIVIGRHDAGGVERFFFGSTSLSVVRNTALPVIVVPQSTSARQVNSIALAIDDQTETLPQEKIRTILQALAAQLHVIHVRSEKTETRNLDEIASGLTTTFRTIHDDEFLHGIQTYLQEHSIDMLMILPHKHSFMERLTFRTHTEELLQKLTIPVLCIADL